MALDNHPNVFHFEGRAWVSELPGPEALAQLRAQRAWDAATIRAQRWWVAIAIGATVGTGATLWIIDQAGLAPVANIIFLPLGFAVGAVLGAIVNKRILGDAIATATATERPQLVHLTRIPPRVVRTADSDSTVEEIITLSGGNKR
jgi:hypothetical protein